MVPLATIVDGATLMKLAIAALAAGVGVTTAFSMAIYGAARASDMRRQHRAVAAGMFVAIALVGAAACTALVVYGFDVMVNKS